MKFRKLLAFVLVFSLAAQPGFARFSHAEETKAEEVKVENKVEASDELAIDLDEAELDEYLFDPGSREQDLEETASVAAEKAAEKSTFSGAIVAAKAAVVAAVSAAVGTLGWMIYNVASNKDAVAEVWTSDEGTFFSRIGKTISILFKGAKALDSGDNSQEIKQSAEETVEPSEVKNEQNVESKQEAQPGEGTEQPTGSDDSSGDVKVEEKDEISEITTESGSAGEDKQKLTEVESQPKDSATSQQNNEKDSPSENPTVVVTSESKEAFIGPATKNVFELTQRKNNLLNTVNKLEDTCGYDGAGIRGELGSVNIENETSLKKLGRAARNLELIEKKLNALRGKCATLGFDKAYIVANIQDAVAILDVSEDSLSLAWKKLNETALTESNLETLAEDYKEIAGRVKVIINNNNAIKGTTAKISKAISGNKDSAWFDGAYYNGQLNEISKKAKTEESLPGIKSELDELLAELNTNYSSKAIKAVTEVLSKINGSKAIKYFESEECSDDDKDDLYAPYEAIIKPLIDEKNNLIAEAKKNHRLAGVAEDLETLVDRERSIVQNIRALNRNTNAINATLERYKDEAYFDKSYFDEWLTGATKGEIATEDDLALRANNVAAFLAGFNTNYSRKDLSKLSSLDKEINELIPEFDNYKLGYKTQYENDYKAKCAELKKKHDASKIIKELEAYKQNIDVQLNKLKNYCENNPSKCGK